jgi:hypothetical protein
MFTQGIATARKCPGRIVIVQEPEPVSAYAIHRHLVESDLLQNTNRVLRGTGGGAEIFRYRYEKPGHGWVQKLVKRTPTAACTHSHTGTLANSSWRPSLFLAI